MNKAGTKGTMDQATPASRPEGTRRPPGPVREQRNEANKLAGSRGLTGFAGSVACAHEDERALRKRRVNEKRGAGEREAEVDVVEEKERRERPKLIEDQEKRPDLEEFAVESRRVKEGGAEDKSAGGNEDGCTNDEQVEHRC